MGYINRAQMFTSLPLILPIEDQLGKREYLLKNFINILSFFHVGVFYSLCSALLFDLTIHIEWRTN